MTEKSAGKVVFTETQLYTVYNFLFILVSMGPCKHPGQDNVIPLSGDAGILFSLLYPRKFEESIACTWVITVPGEHFVRLRIKVFAFGICERSSFEIRDGESSSSDLLKSFCRTFDKDVFSSGRTVLKIPLAEITSMLCLKRSGNVRLKFPSQRVLYDIWL